jgi:ArsR family transcriptional regulator, arsenate/arsenite/antimonite-responsive transcriptional repressor
MKRSKLKSTADNSHELISIFRALSDPSRFALVKLLAGRSQAAGDRESGSKPLCVNALAQRLNITQSAVSQHLRVLRHTGLVRGERRGAFVHYAVDVDSLDQALASIRGVLGIGRTSK